ncbi:hypothetical protein GCM10010353_24030 [Streptomyces chryseus]|nr:hypothetical protein GCM10010353_24030 [Streptomyces chryseus]
MGEYGLRLRGFRIVQGGGHVLGHASSNSFRGAEPVGAVLGVGRSVFGTLFDAATHRGDNFPAGVS